MMNPKTIQTMSTALICVSEVEDGSQLLNVPYIYETGLRLFELNLTWESPSCDSASMASENALQAAKGENQLIDLSGMESITHNNDQNDRIPIKV